jgi:hypothetical protein
MTVIAFSGEARRLYGPERKFVEYVIDELEADVYVSGAAQGVDSFAAGCAVRAHPDAKHVVVVPRHRDGLCAHYDAGVEALLRLADRLGAKIEIELGPVGRDERDGYMKRNDVLAERCDVLHAFPETRRERLRSGTRATVRRAWARDRDVVLHPLEEVQVPNQGESE